MKKFGFTLAEVLMTLAIIGVVATMTMPSLMTNVQKHQVGPALAKAVNTLENANRLLLSQTGARNLSEACGMDNYTAHNYFVCLQEKNILFTTRVEDKPSITNFRGATVINSNSGEYFATKDGMRYFSILPFNANPYKVLNSNLSNAYYGSYITIIADINGVKQPNSYGRDLFQLIIDQKGSVIPYGGNLMRAYTLLGFHWKDDCNDSSVLAGTTCAGAIADNNWQVKYKW